MDDNQEQQDFDGMEDGSHLSADEERLLGELGLFGATRREFLGQSTAAVLGTFAFGLLAQEEALAQLAPSPGASMAPTPRLENAVRVLLKINGAPQRLEVDSRMALLDLLRERVGLTGTKKGCDQGQCGACTVMVDGRRVLSCLTLAASCEGKDVTTIEGLAKGDQLHPMQAAFIKHDGFQCGYCTPGQICSAVALLQEARNGDASHVTADVRARGRNINLSEEEIKERMSGNICRCGAYPGIVAAIKEVQSGTRTAQTWEFASDERIALAMNDGAINDGGRRTDEII
ncbi:MAG: 2Fe-2S iron-sulfur cluster binding domain-containing protein [Armatimonadetes bacterium]|nr:2Fe-2S iron-sulfur cluster binding domain-containing protein [Armatimonadota bacterium]